jgi:hypothetical protein
MISNVMTLGDDPGRIHMGLQPTLWRQELPSGSQVLQQ